ncbi:MAG: hypothetical protein MUE52_17340 [Tabrizicola sp.]|jgi:hypothetical protein|nr:hypothetical protein [Tabrizicola sp.]
MAILMTSDVSGQTAEGYDGMLTKVGPALRLAKGLILHTAHPVDGGWRIMEIWETREDATRFFATAIAPHLPKGLHPKLSFTPLHDMLQP